MVLEEFVRFIILVCCHIDFLERLSSFNDLNAHCYIGLLVWVVQNFADGIE